jgi:hypothetical protein
MLLKSDPTKIAAARAAFDKVTNTVELLDNILQNLSPKNIFGLQRVNKAFYHHIRGDTLAAKRLYLSPKSQQTDITCVLRDSGLVNNEFYKLPFSCCTVIEPDHSYI